MDGFEETDKQHNEAQNGTQKATHFFFYLEFLFIPKRLYLKPKMA